MAPIRRGEDRNVITISEDTMHTTISINPPTVTGTGVGFVAVSVSATVANANGATPYIQFTDANEPTPMNAGPASAGNGDTWTANTQQMMDSGAYTLLVSCNGVTAAQPYTVQPTPTLVQ